VVEFTLSGIVDVKIQIHYLREAMTCMAVCVHVCARAYVCVCVCARARARSVYYCWPKPVF